MNDYPLTQFQDHLIKTGLSPQTSATYALWVRKLLRETVGEPPSKEVILEYDEVLPTKYRGQFRAAWRKYEEYVSTTNTEHVIERVNFPLRVRSGRNRNQHPMQAAIAALIAAGIRPREIEQLRWVDMRGPSEGMAVVRDTHFFEYKLPIPLIKALREWAQPKDSNSPLVPEAPKSPRPMSSWRLTKAAVKIDPLTA